MSEADKSSCGTKAHLDCSGLPGCPDSDEPEIEVENERVHDDQTCQKDVAGDSTGHLSKRQLRKMKKHQVWLERLPEKRAKEKMKKKQRRQEALARGDSLGPTRKMLKLNSMEKSSCKVKVVLDCSFDEYMNERDIMKLSKQVGFCYSANRRAENPLQFYVCGLHGQMKDRMESVGDYKHWDVNFIDKDYHEVFDHDKIVYLSADSPNVLDDLSDDGVYIIGGLVDHNQYRGLCHEMAVERGIKHAQLPIGQYIEMKSRRILTVNHVFEILLKYTEKKDWKESFFTVIPQRKVAGGKDNEDEPHQLLACSDSKSECKTENVASSGENDNCDEDRLGGNNSSQRVTMDNIDSCKFDKSEGDLTVCDEKNVSLNSNELPTNMQENCTVVCTDKS